VTRCWEAITREVGPVGGAAVIAAETVVTAADAAGIAPDVAIIAHGGVIRSNLSGITGTPLIDSFKAFSLNYGCVVRLFETDGRWEYEVLWNHVPAEKEQHKPKAFYQ
jgi:broad specificity phosphatase PhoE